MIQERDFRKIRSVLERYDSLLIGEGVQRPSYDVCMDPNQGAGFAAKNRETLEAIWRIPIEKQKPLSNRLWEITERLSWAHVLDRSYFYPN